MVFARFKGGEGNFTKGRTYIVEPNSSDVVDLRIVRVEDDNGKRVDITEHSSFEFCEEVYAVLIREVWPGSRVGEIVSLYDVSLGLNASWIASCRDKGGTTHTIGFWLFVILDHTNLQVGTVVKDSLGHWCPITRIDDSFWVKTERYLDMVSLDKFELSVTDGEIDLFRMARCINDIGADELTNGNQYRVIWESCEEVEVWDDNGIESRYDISRFEFI